MSQRLSWVPPHPGHCHMSQSEYRAVILTLALSWICPQIPHCTGNVIPLVSGTNRELPNWSYSNTRFPDQLSAGRLKKLIQMSLCFGHTSVVRHLTWLVRPTLDVRIHCPISIINSHETEIFCMKSVTDGNVGSLNTYRNFIRVKMHYAPFLVLQATCRTSTANI